MQYYHMEHGDDKGPYPYAVNVEKEAKRNDDFRKAVWTGDHLQMTVMSIPPGKDIGMEMHPDTDQQLRIEQGQAAVTMGERRNQMENRRYLFQGDALFVPAGTWHNVMNTGRVNLKVSSIYAPPNHPRGIVQETKEDAERDEERYPLE